jgi:tRNA(fMet)-specific endonuclease VapC
VILIDSDVLIRYLRGDANTAARIKALQANEVLACSVMTTFEVLRAAKPHQLAGTETFLGTFVQLPVTEAISRDAAAEYRAFRSRNMILGTPDLLIGCTARAHDVPLLTGNVRHFPLAGLVVLTV